MPVNKSHSPMMMMNMGSTWSFSRGVYTMMLVLLLLLTLQQQRVECRYLPTRSHGDDLDKLRELMLQILESSNEDQPQRVPPPNEANGNTVGASRSAWLNKMSGTSAFDNFAEALQQQQDAKKYAQRHGGGMYDNGHYY